MVLVTWTIRLNRLCPIRVATPRGHYISSTEIAFADPASAVLSPERGRVPLASQPQEPAAFFPSATTRRSASLIASAEPKCDQSSASMATISPTLLLAWCPRPGRRRNRGSSISGISSRDVALGSLGFFIESSLVSRGIARADDADAVVVLGGYNVEDTPGRRSCLRDEIWRLQAVVEVLGERVPHGERGFLEAHAVLCDVARGLGLIPLDLERRNPRSSSAARTARYHHRCEFVPSDALCIAAGLAEAVS